MDLKQRFEAAAPEGAEVWSVEVMDQRSNMVVRLRYRGWNFLLSAWELGPIPIDRLEGMVDRLARNFSDMVKREGFRDGEAGQA